MTADLLKVRNVSTADRLVGNHLAFAERNAAALHDCLGSLMEAPVAVQAPSARSVATPSPWGSRPRRRRPDCYASGRATSGLGSDLGAASRWRGLLKSHPWSRALRSCRIKTCPWSPPFLAPPNKPLPLEPSAPSPLRRRPRAQVTRRTSPVASGAPEAPLAPGPDDATGRPDACRGR